MYNLTNITTSNNYYEILVATNDMTGGWIGLFWLVSLFVVMFVVFKRREQDTLAVLLTDSVITSIIGVLLWAMNLLAWYVLIIPITLIFVFAVAYKWS